MTKRSRLDALKNKMAADTSLPLRETAINLVFGEGSIYPKIYFLGEAPGRHEDESGRPFVGQAGKLLNKLIEEIGLTRDDVYITSVLRYRPPQNRDPKPDELAAFKP
jgi:DNA polymerase